MTIQMDEETLAASQDGMQVSSMIELPFPAPYLWVINGDVKLKASGGAQYFGGFSTDAEKLIEAGLPYNQTEPPAGWTREEIIAANGKSIDSFMSRSVIVAPIDFRKSWFWKTPGGIAQRSADYFQGARQHVQALVYLSGKKDGAFVPWGPAVLSAKGFQAKNLLHAFEVWNKATDGQRKKVAPGVPAWFFYLAIGTFGPDRKTEMVGQGSQQSPITPISAYVPDVITPEQVEALFVGNDIAKEMMLTKKDAAEWLKAWGTPTPRGVVPVAGAPIVAETGNALPPEEPPFEEEEVPF